MYSHDYYDRLAYDKMFYDFVEERMKEQRKETMETIKSIVLPDYAEGFAKVLCAAFENGSSDAEKIWIRLGFNASNFFAINEDIKGYFENYKEKERWSIDYE
jgi:hypothetical protein